MDSSVFTISFSFTLHISSISTTIQLPGCNNIRTHLGAIPTKRGLSNERVLSNGRVLSNKGSPFCDIVEVKGKENNNNSYNNN